MGATAKKTWFSFFLVSSSCLVLLLSIIFKIWAGEEKMDGRSWIYLITLGVSSSLLLAVSVVCFDIFMLDPADKLPIKVILKLYKDNRKITLFAKKVLTKYLHGCQNIQSQQEQFLLELLILNQNTEYGRDMKFPEINSVAAYKKKHKISKYDTFKPYIDRVCDGEKNVMTALVPFAIATTSGTTGNPKLFPVVDYYELTWSGLANLFFYNPIQKGAKLKLKYSVVLGHKPKIGTTKSGLLSGPLTYFYRHDLPYMTSPSCVFEIPHESSSLYVHAIFACREREVGMMSLLFSYQAYNFFTFLENYWQAICDDIEKGTLSTENVTISDEIRKQIEKNLYVDSDRAEELRIEFRKGTVCLAKRLWPDLEFCRATTTGSMATYGKLLQQSFLKDVILISNSYGGSEGMYAMNMTTVKDDPTYHLSYPHGFFEFIPEENIEEDQPETLLAHELKEGEMYELVVTNHIGLYRYRVGDVVKVIGHTYQCPIIEMMFRTGQILNILGEKTTEQTFYTALEHAIEKLNIVINDYTTCEDIHLHGIKVLDGYTRHYVLFIELNRTLSEKEATEFDKALCTVSEVYNNMRTNRQSVSAMEVIQVQTGTFLKLKDRMIQETQNPQFKMPRALRIEEHLSFLLDNSIRS